MNLADVFAITLIIIGFLIVYVAYWLMSAGLFPRFATRTSEQIARSPVKTTLIGAITLVPLLFIGFGIGNKIPNPAVKLVGFGLVLVSLLAALFGSAGLALRIGQGLKSSRDDEEPWRRVLRGGIVLALTFVMPFLGTFVLMPFAFLVGFGAFVICLVRKASAPVAETLAVPAPANVPPPMPIASVAP